MALAVLPVAVLERVLDALPACDVFRLLFLVRTAWPWPRVHVRELNLAGLRVTDRTLAFLARGHVRLSYERLSLAACPALTPRALKYLPPELCEADLTRLAHAVTDKSLTALARCTRLQRVTLAHCTRITDMGVRALVAALPALYQLNVHGCALLTPACVAELAAEPLRLQVDIFNERVRPIVESKDSLTQGEGTLS